MLIAQRVAATASGCLATFNLLHRPIMKVIRTNLHMYLDICQYQIQFDAFQHIANFPGTRSITRVHERERVPGYPGKSLIIIRT